MKRWIVYAIMAAVLWLCGRIANGQPPGRRLPTCRVAADVGQAVEVVRRANADYIVSLERLHADMVRLLEAERQTTEALRRYHDGLRTTRDGRGQMENPHPAGRRPPGAADRP